MAKQRTLVTASGVDSLSVWQVGSENGRYVIFGRRVNWFGIGALLLATFAFPSATDGAADHPTKPKATAQALPAPGTYEIDPPHTFAYFDARHKVVGLVRGRFD